MNPHMVPGQCPKEVSGGVVSWLIILFLIIYCTMTKGPKTPRNASDAITLACYGFYLLYGPLDRIARILVFILDV